MVAAKIGDFVAISRSMLAAIVTLRSSMEADRCRTLLFEASILITATRSCIARSMKLLAPFTLVGARYPSGDLLEAPRAPGKSSSHPPSTPPL